MNARSAPKKALCLLIFMALGMISASTFAQSREYRRGYDKGYADGVASEKENYNQQSESSRRIVILDANYGTADARCDARDAVQRLAQGQRQVDILVNNQICGDPAENQSKQLVVVYRCGEGQVQSAVMGESKTMSLRCR